MCMSPDYTLLDNYYDDPLAFVRETPSNQILSELKDQMDRMEKFLYRFQTEVFQRMEKLEEKINTQCPQPRIPLAEIIQTTQPAINGELENTTVQAVMNNSKIKTGVQLGMELSKVLFTEREMASSTLTGRTVNGQQRGVLDPPKLKLIDNLIQQRFSMPEAELAATRSAFRLALANCCKYLRIKLAPQNQILI